MLDDAPTDYFYFIFFYTLGFIGCFDLYAFLMNYLVKNPLNKVSLELVFYIMLILPFCVLYYLRIEKYF